ncbi:MAG: DMT family transporter [Burkholderiales bacterium]
MNQRAWVYAGLATGVLVVSTAAILIRIAQAEGASSMAIAAWRLGVASLVLAPIVWHRAGAELRSLGAKEIGLALFSGAFLAVHFGSWITSLEHTSVASSTALVTTNPLWVGIASVFFLRERLTLPVALGIGIATAGTVAMFLAEPATSAQRLANPVLGNSLALVGAISASAYLIIGRSLRARLSLLAYIWLAYGAAAIMLFATVLVRGESITGFTSTAYLCVLALALGPQLLGHTLLNWSVRQVPATLVALSILGEPVGSALLAFFLFGESIGWIQGAAFALILLGIFCATRAKA